MTVSTRRAFAAAFALLSVGCLAAPAAAEEVTFVIRNEHPNALRLELYSQDRNHVWPGGGKDYYLDDGETKEIGISCQEGEAICYGAWVDGDQGTYWGVGPGDKEACDDCCYVCTSGETEEIVLVP